MPSSVCRRLSEWAVRRGFAIAWGDPELIDETRDEIRRRKEDGEFDEAFYAVALGSGFRYASSGEVEPVRSILVLAIPRPAHLLRFETPEGPLDAVIPPTYVFYREFARGIREEIQAVAGDRVRLESMSAPHKLVAARTGLVVYGRNNITYTRDFGSYQQLVAFLTDIEAGDAVAQSRPPSMMEECGDCRICRNACPTGAIGSDRFLLHAERCVTFLNEYPDPWPEWVPARAHNALEGCMRCQELCPMNRGKLRYERLPEDFGADETRTILADVDPRGKREGSAWDGIRAKLAAVGLAGLDGVLGRNLQALKVAKSSLGHA